MFVGLFSKNDFYRKTLSEILMKRGDGRFQVFSFSDMERLNLFKEKATLDVLLIEEEVYEALREKNNLSGFADQYIIISDQQSEEILYKGNDIYISKYASVSYMTKEIRGLNNPKNDIACNNECKVIGIASEVHCCGKTSLAYQLCQQLQEKAKALLITFDYRNPIFTSSDSGLSGILYEFCKDSMTGEFCSLDQKEFPLDAFQSVLEQNVMKFDGIAYLPASSSKYEMDMIQDAHISMLIAYLRDLGTYQYVVIDFSEKLLYGESLGSCDVVICPTKKDCFSEYYTKRFLSGVMKSKEVILPSVKCSSTPENYYMELQWGPFYSATNKLITELGL